MNPARAVTFPFIESQPQAPDYGIYGLLELLANFWQNGFLMTSPQEGESANRRVHIGDLNGGPGWT
jgi:hypothetical protein